MGPFDLAAGECGERSAVAAERCVEAFGARILSA
jgi:hypothetical protein